MDVEDAFTQEAIAAARTDVDGELETEVREMIHRVCQAAETELSHEQENVALLCFIAGRTYQNDLTDEPLIAVQMNGQLVSDFLRFLAQEGRE